MYASELIGALKSTNFIDCFSGIYSRDTVPKSLKNGHFIIVNRDFSHQKGSHWYAVVRLGKIIEIFDSLGISDPSVKQFLQSTFNFKGVTQIKCNLTALQSVSSVHCGYYSLFYLWERYHNFDLEYNSLLNSILSSDVDNNEQIVLNAMKDYFGIKSAHHAGY